MWPGNWRFVSLNDAFCAILPRLFLHKRPAWKTERDTRQASTPMRCACATRQSQTRRARRAQLSALFPLGLDARRDATGEQALDSDHRGHTIADVDDLKLWKRGDVEGMNGNSLGFVLASTTRRVSSIQPSTRPVAASVLDVPLVFTLIWFEPLLHSPGVPTFTSPAMATLPPGETAAGVAHAASPIVLSWLPDHETRTSVPTNWSSWSPTLQSTPVAVGNAV